MLPELLWWDRFQLFYLPAIDEPNFLLHPEKARLRDSHQVLGVFYNGIAKAYPISIMNWHEVVNDSYGADPVVVTFCPLCGSGMAFTANVKGISLRFGVSGLLYNSDVLLYDRKSNSLWSQILGQGVTGKYKGTILQQIPVEHTRLISTEGKLLTPYLPFCTVR